MARNMSNGRQVARPAQGKNSGFKEDPKWAPTPQPAPPVIGTGTVSKPKGTGSWRPTLLPGPSKTVQNPGPPV
jgi:hypothetical protein